MTTTVAVLGLGAIGGIAAGSLAALNRHEVIVCTRSVIDRLVVERPDDIVDVPVRALTDPEKASPVDWIRCQPRRIRRLLFAVARPALRSQVPRGGPAKRHRSGRPVSSLCACGCHRTHHCVL